MSDEARTKRARRLEQWAETAMARLIQSGPHEDFDYKAIAETAWILAIRMEDERAKTLSALKDLEPMSANYS